MQTRLDPFLEPTSTKQQGISFLLKETTGAFVGGQTHDCLITSQTRYPLRHAAYLKVSSNIGEIKYKT